MSDAPTNASPAPAAPLDFIRQIVTEDLKTGRHGARVHTRFPPEPNGYLHIGHAKSICLNFGVAAEFGGLCNLRLDDTNPTREDVEYVDSIREDVRWLGFDWAGREFYASDYFEQIYACAVALIGRGLAYVDSLSADEIREYRGTLTQPGRNSPFRDRPAEENLSLFDRMRQGEFPDGTHVLRARIDMASPNMNMRDPTLFRIRHAHHHRTGDTWCIYPMYDFAHALSDAIEGITHSLCTLEFEDHRPLYNWIIEQFPDLPGDPQQIEFARLNLTYTVLSKRKLLELVEKRVVSGWDDPRMPTISGMRRRGYTPRSIREFCARIGVAKNESLIDVALLEHSVREDLNQVAPRAMAVLKPLKVVIENYPEGQVEMMEAINNPEDATRRDAAGALHARAVHRAGRLPRGAAEEVLPAVSGQRGAAALRVHHQVRVDRQERRGRGDRSALHVRPAHPRRLGRGRPSGQGHAALGVGRARRARRSPALRPALHHRTARWRRQPSLHRGDEPARARGER